MPASTAWMMPLLVCNASTTFGTIMFSRQTHRLDNMSAMWLLPIAPAEVAAASGALLAPHLTQATAHVVLGVSVLLWTLSVPLALGVLSILFMRLALHSIPPREIAVSSWLTLGPLGTGALAMTLFAGGATRALAGTSLAALSDGAHGVALIIALLLWGYGVWGWVMAIIMTVHHARTSLPFNMGWWAFTFPLGVYTAATFALGHELQIASFVVLGGAFVVALTIFWTIVTARTLHGTWEGYLFRAPCLSSR